MASKAGAKVVSSTRSASPASRAQATALVPRTLKLTRPVPRTSPTRPAIAATRTATETGSTTTKDGQIAPEGSVVRMVACSPADVPASVDVYMSAFGRGPLTYWWPPRKHLDDGMRAWQERRFANRHADERSVQLMAVLVDRDDDDDDDENNVDNNVDDGGTERQQWHNPKVKTEDVVAYAKWTLPSPELSEDGRRHFESLREALLGTSSPLSPSQSKGAAAEPRTANSTTTKTTAAMTERCAATFHDPGGAAVLGDDDSNNESMKSFRADHPADLPEGTNAAYYKEFFDVLERLGKKWRLDEMLELSLMCTRPSHHGHGIAAAMIRSVLDVADREGIRTILLGMELATPLYRRLGFETVETAGFELARREAGEDGVMHVMIREPRVGVDEQL